MSRIWAQNISPGEFIREQPMITTKPLLLSGMLLLPHTTAVTMTRQGSRPRRRSCKTWCDKRGEAPMYECSTSSTSKHLVESLPISSGSTCSITIAFTSMVFMLRGLQSCALQMRQLVRCEADFQSLLASVQMDMHCSLLWLFQRVFSSTPRLMLTLMIILANFVAFNLEQQQQQVPQSPPPLTSNQSPPSPPKPLPKESTSTITSTSAPDVYISGNLTAGLNDDRVVNREEDSLLMVSLLEQAARQHQAENNGCTPHAVDVTLEVVVAPVSVQLEPDNYECFDRTEILYQDALNADRHNPLLLANYAEFLFLVRRDYKRAQTLFTLAMNADPDDAEIISRYAKFVWLVKGDKGAAEQAYRAAMAAEPSNPFYAGCYAHFLWHSAEEQAASRLIRSAHRRTDQS